MRRTSIFVTAAAIAGAGYLLAPVASVAEASGGAHSGKTTPAATGLALSSQNTWNNPNSPSWCFNEDDHDFRTFTGSISGTFSTPYQMCNESADYYNGIWWDAGGEGLEADAYVVGQLSDVAITAPDGTAHHGVLVGQSTYKGTTTYHYAVCYVPNYSVATNTGGTPLAGGTWQFSLSGQLSSVSFTTRDAMTDANFQQSYCPASEQNLS